MPALDIPKRFKRRLDKKGKKKPELVAAILACIQRLGEDPRHPGLESHKVHGTPGVFESYVDKANRVTWHWDGDTIVMRNHCNHDILDQNP